jgi:hypothetical protein
MPEVSTYGGGHGNAGSGDAAGTASRCRVTGAVTRGGGAEFVGAALREDEGEFGVHVGFLSMASTSSQDELRSMGAHREKGAT